MVIEDKFLRVKWYDPDKHLTQLVELHAQCFPQEEWKPRDFRKFLNKAGRNNILKVLEDEEHNVHGSLAYTLTANTCLIRRVGVFEQYRRKGLATHIVNTLTGPRSPIRKKLFVARVRESNYPAQALFHSKMKFTFDPNAKRDKIGEEEIYVFSFLKIPAHAEVVCEGK